MLTDHFPNEKVLMSCFEGCVNRYPLARRERAVLYWTIELHEKRSRGNFEVVNGENRWLFKELGEAINKLNEL